MTECNAIIEANNEIEKLQIENKKLNELCVKYGFEMGRLAEENEQLKQYTKQVLQNHLDGWRGVYNPIDESIVVEICVVKSIAEDLGVDLE